MAHPLLSTPRAIARAATAIEERLPSADNLLRSLFPETGRALVVGITGPPGAGKSTSTDQLIALCRSQGKRVAVLAVDPSSPFTGGALLGDRIRMQRHHADADVFIRSLATRGNLGGLSTATSDLTLLLDAAGYDVILIETVGVGQDEVDVAGVADVTAVLLVPGFGDDVQAIKAGIMEVADVYILNKADQPGIERLEKDVQFVLGLSVRQDGWRPPIVRCVASEARGIDEAWKAIMDFAQSGRGIDRKQRGWELRLRDLFRERVEALIDRQEWTAAAEAVRERRTDPYTLVQKWMQRFRA